MEDHDAVNILRRCKDEIQHLQHTISVLAPKADAYDQLLKVLKLLPEPSQGVGEDLAWRLQCRIDALEWTIGKQTPAVAVVGGDAGSGP